jgi:thymidylate synthase (FAD)
MDYHMEVSLIDKMGTDALVVDAARVSFSKEAANYTKEQNDKLIHYLARHGHFTPFTHPQIVVREKVPIFVARQRFKHTVGFSYNEVSRRYVDDKPEFYIPSAWRGAPVGAKQGSSDVEIKCLDYGYDEDAQCNILIQVNEDYKFFLEYAETLYNKMIEDGIAPEQARMVLPQSMYTEYYVTGSLSAWARAYKLRIDPHAQKEIRDVAVKWDEIIRPLFPVSWSALVDDNNS